MWVRDTPVRRIFFASSRHAYTLTVVVLTLHNTSDRNGIFATWWVGKEKGIWAALNCWSTGTFRHNVSRAHEKEKISSARQLSGEKHLADVNGPTGWTPEKGNRCHDNNKGKHSTTCCSFPSAPKNAPQIYFSKFIYSKAFSFSRDHFNWIRQWHGSTM